jgi:hypothetical protein
LTPFILARTLQNATSGKNTEEDAVEQRLMKVLVQFVQSESQASDETLERGNSDFSVELLKSLKQCVKTVMVAQNEKNQLRASLLSSRHRAEVMHNIIQVGDKIAKALTEESNIAVQWDQMREVFMAKLDN